MSVLMLLRILAIIFSFSPGISHSKTLQISEDQSASNVIPFSLFLEDQTQALTIEQIRSESYSSSFQPIGKDVANFGMTGHAYWFHFKIQNTNPTHLSRVLSIEYALLDHIDLYYSNPDGSLAHTQSGDRLDFNHREIKNRFFNFNINWSAGEEKEFFLRIQTDGAAEIPLRLRTFVKYAAEDHENQFHRGLFSGTMAILFLYNLFIWFGSKNKEYFYISMFIMVFLLFKSSMDGLTNEYLWPQSVWWANQSSAFLTPLVYVTALICGYVFLPVNNFAKIRLTFRVGIAILSIYTVASFFVPYRFIRFSVILGITSMAVMGFFSLYIYLKGFKPARLFFLSWFTLIVGAVIFGLQKMGLIPVSFVSENGLEIGAALQALFLSLGQAEKINEINKSIRSAKEKALQAQIETNRVTEEMNDRLEVMVQERTRTIRTIVDNVKSGFLLVDSHLKIQDGFTRSCEQIFGQNLCAGQKFSSLFQFATREEEQFNLALGQVFADVLPEDVCLSQIGKRFRIGKQVVNIEGSVIRSDKTQIDSILFTIIDSTELDQAEKESSANHALLKIVKDKVAFKSFIKEATFDIVDALATLRQAPDYDLKLILHTLKGNYAAFGLTHIANYIHKMEDKDKVRVEELAQINKLAEDYLSSNHNIIGFDLKSIDQQVFTVNEGSLVELRSRLKSASQVPEAISIYDLWHQEIHKTTVTEMTSHLAGAVEEIAKKLEKKVDFRLIGGDLPVDPERFSSVFYNIIHLIRNSVDHGIEYPDDRGDKGEVGHISLSFHENDQNQLVIRVQDDGAGIDTKTIRNILLTKNVLSELEIKCKSDSEINQYIFVEGVSTKSEASTISGRGAGLSALKKVLDDLGGHIKVTTRQGEGTTFELVLALSAASQTTSGKISA